MPDLWGGQQDEGQTGRSYEGTMQHRSVVLALCLAVAAAEAGAGEPKPVYGKIELVRDRWGIAHVFSETDEGAMYGLGWACAGERGFQMHYALRIIQGRLAEVIGEAKKVRRRETAVQNDRKMRTFGFYRAAKRVAGALDGDTRRMLDAYCEGVNDYFAAHAGRAHPLFAKLGLRPEPWTAADCIASWWHLAQFFATDGTRELLHWRNVTGRGPAARRGMPQPTPGPLWRDEASAVVQREDVSDDWIRRTEQFLQKHGFPPPEPQGAPPAGPKFSHAWVVGGRRTTTGSAVLVSDPQTPVRNPSLWQEFHVCGKTFNARGIGVPGSPGILLGFNRHVAWGVTALGADQADLFRLKTDPKRPDEYCVDGQWWKMDVRRETVRVKGGRDREITVRETCFGPVVNEFAFARPDDPPVALKRVPICQTRTETIQALFAMMRAGTAGQFNDALAGWHFPSCNMLFGDGKGNIGYRLLAAVPVRSPQDEHGGRAAQDGSTAKSDWQGWVPHDLKPHVMNPKRGWIASGNHCPVGSFYRIPLGISTGSMGHTIRSWRLYELLGAKERFRPEEVLAVHYDCVNPARREIVRIGYHLRDVLKRTLSPDAAAALKHLEPWYRGGCRSEMSLLGTPTAMEISTFFRFVATRLALKYGGGYSGLARFLRDVDRRLAADPKAAIDPLEQAFVDNALATAWRAGAGRRNGTRRGRQQLGWFDSLDGFGSIDASGDVTAPPLAVTDGHTIRSQQAQSYTQYVPLHDPDAAMSILPVGHSDRADSPYRTSTMKLWETGKLHPAPVSRAAVDKIADKAVVLAR